MRAITCSPHYWLSGMKTPARTLRERHQIPMVHTMHTMARVKNELRGDGPQATEPDVRERGEAEDRRRGGHP